MSPDPIGLVAEPRREEGRARLAHLRATPAPFVGSGEHHALALGRASLGTIRGVAMVPPSALGRGLGG